MHKKPAITCAPIDDIIGDRWSPRSFNSGKYIDDKTLTALLEAARWAPSCFNDQPWRFVVCRKQKDEAAWNKLLSCLGEKNRRWAENAPLLILSVAMHNFGHNGKPNRWALFDTGAACVSLCLQATALGLASHQMGGFDSELSRQLFNLPGNCTPMSVIAIGFQAEASLLGEELKQKELSERTRKPLNECFYFGTWGD